MNPCTGHQSGEMQYLSQKTDLKALVKILGSMLIIISLGMIGFIKAEKLKKRYEEMLDFKKILVMLQGEIRYNNSAIAEAFLHVSKHFKGAYASILDEASGRTSDNSGESFEKIWLEID